MADPVTIALQVLPAAIKTLNALTGFGKSKPSDTERKLFNMSEIFGEESSVPLTETTAYKSGKSQLEAQDEKNRRAIENRSAVTGATDEAKLARVQDSNESLNRGLHRLLQYADREQDQNRRSYMNSLGALESLRSNRKSRHAQKWNNILGSAGEAGQVMWMSDIFGGDKKKLKEASDTLSDILNTPGGSAGWV